MHFVHKELHSHTVSILIMQFESLYTKKDHAVSRKAIFSYECHAMFGISGLVHLPGSTLVSEKASCIMYHPCFILLPSAHWAALPPRKPLKGLQTCFVENMRTRQQHLDRDKR